MTDSKTSVIKRNMGPVLAGTLVAKNIQLCADAYVSYLELEISERGEIPASLAEGWGMPELEGAPYLILVSLSGVKWLRMIEQPDSEPDKPIASYGWMSLEVLVDDVYAVAEQLKESPFHFIGQPAKLDVSDSITACQVVGPAGEVLYLTSVAAPVPPFELPMSSCRVDRLFIPVMAVPDREASMAYYEQLANSKPLAFDTKVTVINNALGKPLERRIPVSTIQLDGESLIELDEVEEFTERARLVSGLVNGISMVTFEVDSFDQVPGEPLSTPFIINDGFYKGCEAALYRGPAGEFLELIKR